MTLTNGVVRLLPSEWVLELEPHVMIRLKRVFPKADVSKLKSVALARTPENAEDLLWFFDRYPVEMDHATKESLVEGRSTFRQTQQRIEQAMGGHHVLNYNLNLPPREYQRAAAELAYATKGLLLADDVGLGKTVSAIALFCRPECLPAVVVTYAGAMPHQWKNEINRFAPQLSVHVAKGGDVPDLTKTKRGRPCRHPDVVVLNYHKVAKWAPTLAKVVKTLVLDECQEARVAEGSNGNPTQKYAGLALLADAATWRLGLSATPIYNYGGEIFNVLRVIAPGRLGERDEFYREWLTGWGAKSSLRDPVAFGKYARDAGLMLQRTKKDVGRELPELIDVPTYVDADASKLDEVASKAAVLAKVLLERGEAFAKMQAAEELSNLLRQATGVAKAPYVAEFVKQLVEGGQPVVLFAWHRLVYDIYREALKDLGPVFFTGEESPTQKEAARQAFIRGETKVMIMSLRAGAGVDGFQHACSVVVFGELDWSDGVHHQCAGRVHRDGQDEPVTAYYMIAEKGSDPIVAEVLGLKRAQRVGLMSRERPVDRMLVGANEDRIKRLAADFLEQRGLKPVLTPSASAPPPPPAVGQTGFGWSKT